MSTAERTLAERIDAFLASAPVGVVGASTNPAKVGYRCLETLLAKGIAAIPVNPRATSILGSDAVADVADLPPEVGALNVITPPPVTAAVLEVAIERGIRHVWIQPGAEEPRSIAQAIEAGLDVIHGGPCLLIALASR